MQLTEEAPVNTTMKTLCIIASVVAAVAIAGMRWEYKLQGVQDTAAIHTQQLAVIQGGLAQLQQEQRTQAALINYIAYGRKGEPPPKADEGH